MIDRLDELYKEFGYYRDALGSYTLKGKDGVERIALLMKNLRGASDPFQNTVQVIDYRKPIEAEIGFGILPISDVLKYILSDGSWIAVRPSGTEPKIKIYYSIKGTDRKDAEKKLERIKQEIQTRLGLE